jgi:hypothetical protein
LSSVWIEPCTCSIIFASCSIIFRGSFCLMFNNK